MMLKPPARATKMLVRVHNLCVEKFYVRRESPRRGSRAMQENCSRDTLPIYPETPLEIRLSCCTGDRVRNKFWEGIAVAQFRPAAGENFFLSFVSARVHAEAIFGMCVTQKHGGLAMQQVSKTLWKWPLVQTSCVLPSSLCNMSVFRWRRRWRTRDMWSESQAVSAAKDRKQ